MPPARIPGQRTGGSNLPPQDPPHGTDRTSQGTTPGAGNRPRPPGLSQHLPAAPSRPGTPAPGGSGPRPLATLPGSTSAGPRPGSRPTAAAAQGTAAATAAATSAAANTTTSASATAAAPTRPAPTTPARRRFRSSVLREIARDPAHLLSFLLEPRPSGKGKRFLNPPTREHHNLIGGHYVEAGHLTSNWSLGSSTGSGGKPPPERLALQDAYSNQLDNISIEQPHIGGYAERQAVDIGGVPVELRTARQWERDGKLPPGTVAAAKPHPGWIVPEARPGAAGAGTTGTTGAAPQTPSAAPITTTPSGPAATSTPAATSPTPSGATPDSEPQNTPPSGGPGHPATPPGH